MNRRQFLKFITSVVSAAFVPVQMVQRTITRVQPTHYYLALDGDDNADGLTYATRKRHISALSDIKDGDVIYLSAGNSQENITVNENGNIEFWF